jgi:hypothetical protein
MTRTKYSDLERTVGEGGVVHLRDPLDQAYASVCHGRFSAATMKKFKDPDSVPTCFWCVVGADGDGIRWFKWADE